MFTIMFDKFVILFVIVNFYSSSADDGKDKTMDGTGGSAMWFGPRLGKRSYKIAPDSDRAFLRMLEAADVLKYYYDQLPYDNQADEPETRVTKKVIFTPKLGRSLEESYKKRAHDIDFTPRLGRRLIEEVGVTASDQDDYQYDPIDTRSKFFSPRLGRSRNFSPRLGRELTYDYPPTVRLTRSVNKTGTP